LFGTTAVAIGSAIDEWAKHEIKKIFFLHSADRAKSQPMTAKPQNVYF